MSDRNGLKSTPSLDFTDTKIAFSDKSDKDLNRLNAMFKLMNNNILVNILSKLGLIALKLRFPFTKRIIRATMFKQFCGGETLIDCQPVIDNLNKYKCLTILDYGAEAKSEDSELDAVREETKKAIIFAASNISVPVVSTKFTGLIKNDLLEKLQNGDRLTDSEQMDVDKFEQRADEIAKTAYDNKVGLFVDAEETWIQQPIDDLVEKLMARYNKERPIIFNTYQMYLKSKLDQLKSDYKIAQEKGYFLGAKLVRGAYMEKEGERAEDLNYENPVHDSKQNTDDSYNAGIRFVVEHYETIGSCNASHNEYSNMLQADLIKEKDININHPHLNFAQLYGMSDHITFNLGNSGYNAAKYLPYGAITDVFPYLVRRAQENKSIAGDMGKELKNILKERKRRKLG